MKLGAWLIGIRGDNTWPAPGIAADMVKLTRWLKEADADVRWITGHSVMDEARKLDGDLVAWVEKRPHAVTQPTRAGLLEVLAELAAYEGERRLWIGGHAALDEFEGATITPEDREARPISLEGLWRRLAEVADEGEGIDPLVVLMGTCHAGPAWIPPSKRLLGLATSRKGQLAYAGPEGSDFVNHLSDALDQGMRSVARVRGFVQDCVGPKQGLPVIGNQDLDQRPLFPGLPAVARVPPTSEAHRTAYRAFVQRQCRHVPAVSLPDTIGDSAEALLEQVYVQVHLERVSPPGESFNEASARTFGRLPLERLLLDHPQARLAVLGEPGSGKTTLARHVAWTLAQDPARPLPLYLPAIHLSRASAFDALEMFVWHGVEAAEKTRFVALLKAEATAGRVWFLVDGLDEVGDAAAARAAISALAEAWPKCAVVVLARRIGFTPLAGFERADVQPLDELAQRHLLRNHLPDHPDIDGLWRDIVRIEALRALVGVPLLLSFIAVAVRDGKDLPTSRHAVYQAALEHYLTRGRPKAQAPNQAARVVPSPAAARQVLAPLACALQALDRQSWTRKRLIGLLTDLELGEYSEGVPEAMGPLLTATTPKRLAYARGQCAPTPEDFVDLIAQCTGILAPYEGPSAHWRFLHKSLHDALCAEQLAHLDDATLVAWVGALKEDDDAMARWSEAMAQVCARRKDPLPLLKALTAVSGPLALRLAPEVDGVSAPELVALVVGIDEWTGEDLLALARRWRSDPERLEAIEVLAAPSAPLETCARVHYALSEVGAFESGGGDDTFFVRIGRPRFAPEDLRLEWTGIPAGTFLMGTIEGGFADECPAHEVALCAFEIGTFVVTKGEFGRFEYEHICGGSDRHPVTGVTWYVARLYARWAEAELPTEAQWEFACRAGKQSLWNFGDDEAKIEEYAWYGGNSGEKTHPVGKKLANPWGLYDMHGNVWEWCADWFGPYSAGPAANPPGPEGGVVRVQRGGCRWNVAVRCRSAFRNGDYPALRSDVIGFRLCRRPQLEV